MARARRTYTPEFKAEAVKLVTEQGYAVAACREFANPRPPTAPRDNRTLRGEHLKTHLRTNGHTR